MTIRIELQDKERELLSGFVVGNQISDVAGAIDQLLSFQNLYIGVTILELVTGKEILLGTPNDVFQLIDWVREFFAKNPFVPDPGVSGFVDWRKPSTLSAGLEGFIEDLWEWLGGGSE